LCARFARRQGAWWAPANAPLDGVVALGGRHDRRAWAAFAGAGVNLIRRHPRGFLPLGADTLAPGLDVRPIGVRRLLILLRRLCLREGSGHIFEPASFAFREGVRRRFEGFLGELHRRGAFAPERASDAFRVVTDVSVNPPQELDRGRFVVELRVAPSRPLAFLTVRLVQTGPQAWSFESSDPLAAGGSGDGLDGGGGG
ncbi:MAG: hypothetical protein MI919_23160, partial [Holophagales bacterium]|nr:hypothetical protein [Holophagales bacterium]